MVQERFGREVDDLRAAYAAAEPFPHIVLDDFLQPETAELAAKEFPESDPEVWASFYHVNERKMSSTDTASWGPTLRAVLDELNSQQFASFLEQLTGIDQLLCDDSLEGGGLHQTLAGGFLNIHADFTVHPRNRQWRRRVNFLLYLNNEWPAEYGGDLELWSRDMKRCELKIAPVANRAVIFTTDGDAFHGHPEPLACPPDAARRSMALYYYTFEEAPVVRSTEYRARPGDGARRMSIYLDKQVLRKYDWAKRRLGLTDKATGKFLRRLDRLRPRRGRP